MRRKEGDRERVEGRESETGWKVERGREMRRERVEGREETGDEEGEGGR